jgi:hypothetical protein
MMARSADNRCCIGRLASSGQQNGPWLLLRAVKAGTGGWTYGRQHEEHHHRRNRLCTYQNCGHVSCCAMRVDGAAMETLQSGVEHEALDALGMHPDGEEGGRSLTHCQ